jgi:hypothetical protein
MMSKLARGLIAALLACLTGLAHADSRHIDLLTVAGVPGTGGSAILQGPCYCQQAATFSPVMLLAPGTYDFGTVRDFWEPSPGTPDAGPTQPNGYLLFGPLENAGSYPDAFPAQPTYAFPSSFAQCDQNDAACNASFDDRFVDTELIYTVLPGQNAVQIGLVGDYRYTAPLPEPRSTALCLLALALMAALAARRAAR